MKMERIVLGGDDAFIARDRLIKGLDYSADMLKKTLGPGGTNVFLEKKNRVTNDGVSIAQEIILDDEVENLGAQKIKEICAKVNDEAGDGTTTAATLAQAILRECKPKLQKIGELKAPMAPMALVKQVEKEKQEVIELLNKSATKIETEQQLIDVATVSVEDPQLGEMIGKTQWAIGPDGHILVEETTVSETEIQMIPGIRIDNGYASSGVINNLEKGTLELTDIPVILTNHTVQSLNVFQGVLQQLIDRGVSGCALIARGFTEEAVQQCLKNINTPNGFKLYPINSPYTDQVQVMYDMQAALGGRFINSEDSELGTVNITDVGHASHIICERFSATFAGKNDEAGIDRREARASNLEKKLESELSDFERRDIKKRISQLRDGIALLKIGGTSETDRRYKKDKADDAVNAVRAAFQEGVVAGAGIALKDISDELPDTYILKQAIRAPYDQIQANAGGLEIESWVKDPVKVIRIALEKACSVAAVFSTAHGVIVTKKQRYNAYIHGNEQ